MAATAAATMKRCAVFIADVLPDGGAFIAHGIARDVAMEVGCRGTEDVPLPFSKIMLAIIGKAAPTTEEQMALAVLAGDRVAARALADKIANGD